ncbi:hypothetical protein FHN55_17225 [Streptomyces sp. NP160]|nr:hypothetical protein FHN55_17225 [Streptomyces sp. NP160]
MVVIGILAAIAVPVFSAQRQKAAETALKADLRNIATAVRSHGLEAGSYPWADDLNTAGTALRTSAGVRVVVLSRSTTDFCLVGTSTGAGPDTSGYAAAARLSTRLMYVSATRPVSTVTSADPGCLTAPGMQFDKGYWDQDGYHVGFPPI